jgi:dolichol-phosphate mannosyltransferase
MASQVTQLAQQMKKGRPVLFEPGSQVRDFVYVDDCNEALITAALKLANQEPGISVNIASGIKTTLEQIANLSQKLFRLTSEAEFGSMPNRKWDLREWYGNPIGFQSKTGWSAKTPVEQGLELTAKWEQSAKEVITIARVAKVNKKITAIIACYRDHQAIPIMHERLTRVFEKIGVDHEIIFVNDCSPTEDEAVITEICNGDPHVIGVSHSRNFGSQSAFLSGMEIATGDAVVLLDGDLQDPPEMIEKFHEEWIKGNDVVYGTRVRREAPAHMQILYKTFYRIFKSLADISIPLDAGDFSLIDRKVVNHLLRLPEKDIFLRGLRAWLGFRQVGVPYIRPERMFGTTTNSFLKNIWWAKKAIFSFSTKPLEYIQRMSVMALILSVTLSIYYLIHYFLSPPAEGKGTTTIILLVLGLSAIQLFATSILGDYLGKVLEEVKSRPRFVKARIIRLGEKLETANQIQSFIDSVSERLSP